jgi:hypothetical protein
MCLTTKEGSSHEYRTFHYAMDFANESVTDSYLPEESSFDIDDGRTSPLKSDLIDISYGKQISDMSHTTVYRMYDERSFSNISDLSDITFENFIFDTPIATTKDEPEERMIKSSNIITHDHLNSLSVFLAISRHSLSQVDSFSTKVRRRRYS